MRHFGRFRRNYLHPRAPGWFLPDLSGQGRVIITHRKLLDTKIYIGYTRRGNGECIRCPFTLPSPAETNPSPVCTQPAGRVMAAVTDCRIGQGDQHKISAGSEHY